MLNYFIRVEKVCSFTLLRVLRSVVLRVQSLTAHDSELSSSRSFVRSRTLVSVAARLLFVRISSSLSRLTVRVLLVSTLVLIAVVLIVVVVVSLVLGVLVGLVTL